MCVTHEHEIKKNKENFHCLRKNAHDEDRCRVRVLNENIKNYYFIKNLITKFFFIFINMRVIERLKNKNKRKLTKNVLEEKQIN